MAQEGDKSPLIDVSDGHQECDGQAGDVETGVVRINGNVQPKESSVNSNNQQQQVEQGGESGGVIKYTSQWAALLIIVNVTVGAGLLAMPYSIQASGLITSLLIQGFFLAMIITTCIMCTELTVKAGVESYHQVVAAHCHPYVYRLAQLTLLMIVFGTTVAYIVIIGDQADRVFASVYGSTFCYSWYMNRRFIMSAVTVFIMKPLCASKTVDFLKYASFAGVLSLLFVTYVVVSEFVRQGHIAKDVNYIPKNWSDIIGVLPVFCLAYQCHLSWVPVTATMRKEEKYTSYKTISGAMVIATIVYASVCILAVLTFGSAIQSDLTESYPDKKWPILTTIAIVALKCVVTLPPAFLPARLSITDILTSNSKRFADLSEPRKRYGVTYVTLSIALVLALFVPDILVAVDILGCLSVMFIFTFPALCYLNLIKENRLMKQRQAGLDDTKPTFSVKDKFKLAISYFLILAGFLMAIAVLYSSIKKILSGETSPPICHKP